MSATTYRYLVGDLTQSFNMQFPDATITSAQMTYWCRVAENFIIQRNLKVTPTGANLTEFNTIPVQSDTIAGIGRKWFVLPSQIYDLMNEKGVDYVSYQNPAVPFNKQVRFQQTDVNVIDRLNYNPYEQPSPSNPYFYRVGPNIYLLGIENIAVPTIQCGLYAALDTRPVILNQDSPIGIEEEQIVSLKEIVFQYARLSLVTPRDRYETGQDERNDSINTFAKATSHQPNEQE